MKSRRILVLVVLTIAFVIVFNGGPGWAELVGYWKLDEISGTTAYDSSGYGRDATLSSGTGYKTPGVNQNGIIGRAYKFNDSSTDNTKCFVRVSPDGLTGFNTFTLSTWIYLPQAWKGTSGRYQMLFYGWDDEPEIAKAYSFTAQSPLRTLAPIYSLNFSVANDGAANCLYPSPALPTDVWHHLAATYDGSTQYLYLDGNVITTNSYSTNCRAMSTPVYLGGYDGTSWGVRGYLDDIGIWNETLSATKIKALYTTPLVAELQTATTGRYGQKDMKDLFTLYDSPAHTPVSIGDQTWYYFASLPNPQGPGKAWYADGEFFIQLGADGSGVSTIPEPSALVLLSCGLLGLLCYAWRKRK